MISNSVTHLRSYTNSAIADIAGNSAPISPVTLRDCRRRRAERRRLWIDCRYHRIEWPWAIELSIVKLNRCRDSHSLRWYRVWIGFLYMCGVWATVQMSNRVTNQSEMGIFSKRAVYDWPLGNCLPGTELLQSAFRSWTRVVKKHFFFILPSPPCFF